MRDIRLIASDMDHTLLTDAGEFPPGFDAAIERLGEAGIVFVAASGRPYATLQSMFPQDNDNIAYISDNGCLVKFRDTVVAESLLPREGYQAMTEFTLTHTPGIPIITGVDSSYVAAEHRERHEAFLRQFYKALTFVDDIRAVDTTVDKFTAFFPEGNSKPYKEQVFSPAFSDNYALTIGGPNWVDIMATGVDKGSGIKALGDHLGIKPSQMMAFGDTDNDLEMLDAVEYSYAVANADAEARRRARYLAESNEDYGVLKVIEQVLSERGFRRDVAIPHN